MTTKLKTLTVPQLKEVLRAYELNTTGVKPELLLRIEEYLDNDVIDSVVLKNIFEPNNTSQLMAEIEKVKEMLENATRLVTIANNSNERREPLGTLANDSEGMRQSSDLPNSSQSIRPVSSRDHQTVSRNYSVREIVETIPEFDPTCEASLLVGQFVERVNNAKNTYQWNEKSLLLAVYSRLNGAAKLWLDCLPKLHPTWEEFSEALIEEFGSTPHEADVHFKMCNAIRKPNETVTDYCFRVCALGRRYRLSDQAIIKYTRDGLQHRDLQNATAVLRFNSVKEMRECFEGYIQNLPDRRNARENEKYNVKYDKYGEKKPTHQVSSTTRSSSNIDKNERKCYNCFEVGHISPQCPKPPRRNRCKDCGRIHSRNEPDNCRKAATINKITKADSFELIIRMNGQNYNAFIDTGSDCHLIKRSCADELQVIPHPCCVNLSGMWGGKCVAREQIKIKAVIDEAEVQLNLLIVDDNVLSNDILLGRELFLENSLHTEIDEGRVKICRKGTIRNMTSDFSNTRNEYTTKAPILSEDIQMGNISEKESIHLLHVINQYRNVFSDGLHDIGKTDMMEMVIMLDSTRPITQKAYRVPEPKKSTVEQMINELLEHDIIQKSSSNYASPMLLVKKKNGTDRLCIDYRQLNKYTTKEVFPTPNVEECLHEAKKYNYFISLDMNSGFYQIPIAEDCCKFTAFVTPYGIYEFKRMPFGLKNAPAMFQRLMQIIRERSPSGLIIYMDDILIGGTTIDEVLKKFELVLKVLEDANLTLNLKKCNFVINTLEFLGHKLTVNGIEPGTIKTECVRKFPRPANATEVRRFLGLCGYFRKFVSRFALISEPLRQLLHKDQPFTWTERQERAFVELIQTLISQPILTGFDVSARQEVHTDACSKGLAGVLMQENNGKLKPVAYYSRTTTENESKYHSYELEALAVVETLERFRYYIYGKEITVVTDCNAITTLTSQKEIIPRIARWWLKVQDFDVKFQHRAGERMMHVDALSRAAVEGPSEIDVVDMRIAKINITVDDWVLSMQLQDPKLRNIIAKLKENDAESSKEYELKEGRLFKKKGNKLLWVIPRSMRWNILHERHDKAGHLGVEKTVQRLLEKVWFARARNFVKSYVKSCVECAYNKSKGGQKGCEYHYSDIEPVPFKIVHVDHLGPFPKSKTRKEHVLMFVDAFTKFVIIKAVRNTSTKYVLEVLNELSSYFGLPERLVSDRGSAFTSNEFRRYCEINNITHQLNAVRTPRANGQVERMNRTVLSMLTTMSENDKIWDTKLRDIQWSLNSMTNSSTGRSALQLLYNFTPRDVLQNKLILALHDDQAISQEEIQERREKAAERINKNKANAKLRFDKTHGKPARYNLGDLVLVESEQTSVGHSRKLEPRYKGPFVITRDLGKDRYVVEDLPKSKRTKHHYTSVYASDKMKKWCQLPDHDNDDGSSSEQEDEDVL